MSAAFEFATAGRIVFGPGRLKEIGALTRVWGIRVLLVTGSNPARAAAVRESLEAAGCTVTSASVVDEPAIELAESLSVQAREAACEVVIGFGGGSVMDAAKAAAALATNPGPARNYLEVIGAGQPLRHAPLPLVAAPTTAGTGAEVTRNAVLHAAKERVKVSLRSPLMLPRVALVDPDTLLTVPDDVMTSTSMDALTQLIETYVSKRANPLTDALCREALPRIARSLERVIRDRTDAAARADVAFASLCSGMALANAGLGAVHGLAAPLGGMYSAPHGAVCAALLLPVLEMNLQVAQTQDGRAETIRRFSDLAALVTRGEQNEAQGLIEWVRRLVTAIGVRGVRRFGVLESEYGLIATRSLAASSMQGNPVPLSPDQVVAILRDAA